IKRECDHAGLPIVSIACVAIGLIDFNPAVQRFHLQRCRAYLDLAYEYEARNVLLVLGEYIWERQVIAPEEQWQIGVRNLQELGRLRGKAIHVHLSDCDGKVHGDLPPGRGVVNFPPYLHEIKDLGIDGAISIELEYAPQPDQIVDWVREAYQASDRLLQETKLRT